MKVLRAAVIAPVSGALSIASITPSAFATSVDQRTAAYLNLGSQSSPGRQTSSTCPLHHKKRAPKHHSHFFKWWS